MRNKGQKRSNKRGHEAHKETSLVLRCITEQLIIFQTMIDRQKLHTHKAVRPETSTATDIVATTSISDAAAADRKRVATKIAAEKLQSSFVAVLHWEDGLTWEDILPALCECDINDIRLAKTKPKAMLKKLKTGQVKIT